MTQQKIKLTQKERMLLQDQKSHEEMCVQKYTNYANQASDPLLKNLFNSYASQEQTHLDSINQMLNGTIPSVSQGGQGGQGQMGQGGQGNQGAQGQMGQGGQGNQGSQGQMGQGGQGNQATMGTTGGNMGGQSRSQYGGGNQTTMGTAGGNTGQGQAGMTNQNDAALCNDVLMTEKYVSSTYDTAIFEFTNHNARKVLNHIQKEEQEHGEGVYNYMNQNGMYNPQG